MRHPKLLLNNKFAGKPEDIYLFIGRHPKAAFGNSTGDQQMLEYTQAGGGASLEMLVLHDDASASMLTARPRGCPIPRSAPSLRRSTTRPRRGAGP